MLWLIFFGCSCTVSNVAEKLLKMLVIKVKMLLNIQILPLNELLRLKELVKAEWQPTTERYGLASSFAISDKNNISFSFRENHA